MEAKLVGGGGKLPKASPTKKPGPNDNVKQESPEQATSVDAFQKSVSEPQISEQDAPLLLGPESRVDSVLEPDPEPGLRAQIDLATSQQVSSTQIDPSKPLLLTEEMMVKGPVFQESFLDSKAAEIEEESFAQSLNRGIKKLLGTDQLDPFQKEADRINGMETEAKKLKTPEQFKAKTAEFKARLEAGASLAEIRTEAYAVAREAARQATGMRAYDCQLLGALAMDDSHIAEMRTGEGKTLTAVLPLYLNALAGKGAHLVTVNETLAKRDAEWMGPIFERMGMSVGCVTENQSLEEKRANYNCDVTYVSDRALGFDYLRDQQAYDPSERVQRGHFFCLIDEVDEVLLDEARTPMIMSGKGDEASSDYKLFDRIVSELDPRYHFKIQEERKNPWPTADGLRYIENELVFREAENRLKQAESGSIEAKDAQKDIDFSTQMRKALMTEAKARHEVEELDKIKPGFFKRLRGRTGKYDAEQHESAKEALERATEARESLSEQGKVINLYAVDNIHRLPYMFASLKAHTVFEKGVGYTLEDGQVKIVDANKGRVSQGKRFSQGLHQALEVKEGLEPREETLTISQITMPELVGLYERKAGMTGTGKTSEGEFIETYGLDVVEIPTNKPVIRVDHPDVVFATKDAKYDAVVAEAMRAAEAGRPVLLGTVSVNANQELAARLLNAGWPADKLQVLNAETVKGGEDSHDPNAGLSGTVTLTTGDRSKLVEHEKFNYKKMAVAAAQLYQDQQKPVVLRAETQAEATKIQGWLEGLGLPSGVVGEPQLDGSPVQLVIEKDKTKADPGKNFATLKREDFAIEKPLLLKVTDKNLEEVLDQALEAYHSGEPVILENSSTKSLGESLEALMDYGIGLEALPMVCEGKEKENVMVQMAGRSGIITVATNMAGRGANVKPDLVVTTKISDIAYEKATSGEAVVISVRKKSQAVKIRRYMEDFIPVGVTDNPEEKAKPGEVLIRYGKELPDVLEGHELKGGDFGTGGLLVIGTERASSKRVDDQLIGRSGRQGAEGDSIFMLSLEDDVPRIYGDEKIEPLRKLFEDESAGLRDEVIDTELSEAQDMVENMHLDQRFHSAKFRDVDQKHRETWYNMREKLLMGEEDPAEFAANFTATGLANLIGVRAGDSYELEDLNRVLEELSEELGMPLDLELRRTVSLDDLAKALYPRIQGFLAHPDLSESGLRTLLLQEMDRSWSSHLDAIKGLREGIHLERYNDGTKPEDVYPRRAFQLFGESVAGYKTNLASVLLPAIARIDNPHFESSQPDAL